MNYNEKLYYILFHTISILSIYLNTEKEILLENWRSTDQNNETFMSITNFIVIDADGSSFVM